MPAISLEINGQPTHSNNTPPTTPASLVTFVSEVIKGAYGELHVDANGQYTFVLNPNSPQYILLNQNKHGTDHFVLNLSDGSKIVVQIPVTGKQDTPTISGDLAGVVTEDHKVDSHGLLHANGKIDVIDPDQNESSMKPEVLAGKYGSLSIDADGHWQYHVDNSLSNIQALTSATSLHESFVIHTQDGTPQTLDMTIGGNDDNAVVTGIDTGVVTEDVTTQIQGQLTVNDSDLGENHFQASQINGHLGTLTITKDGAWTYALDNSNPAVQRLAQGSTATDIITVHSADGTAHQVTVTITGTGDAATIGGVDTGSIIENTAGVNMSPDYAQPGIATLGNTTLYADGKLTITDPDVGESGFERQGSNGYDYHGTYGDLILLTDGTWHYHADAGHLSGIGARPTTRGTAIDQLGEGQSLTDTITVHSKDGTTHDIVITIHGSNDRPYCSSEVVLANGSEDTRQTLTTAQLLANTVDVDANDAGKLTIENLHVDHGSILNNADGTFTFTPEKDYNGDVHFSYDVKDTHGGMTHTGASTTLAAVQDNAVIAGIDIGSVTEDLNPHASVQGNYAYKLEAQGSLSAIDPDKDESGFDFKTLISAAMHPEWRPYSSSLGGQLAIDPKGNWNYYIDNRKPEIQHLGKGETLTDTVTVHSKDGTTHDIVITIHGTNDAPTVSSEVQLNSGKEDSVQTITAADLLAHATDIDNNDQGQLTVANLIANHGSIRDNQDGTYTFTPEKDYNGVVQFNYDVIDRHGGITHTGATINLVAVNDASVLASELSSNEVIEDHLSGSSTHTLTSYWKNLDITDTDGQTDAQIVKIEVNGVEHNVPANFAITLQGAHGSFVTTHGVDGHNKWRYVADNNHTEIQQLKDGQSLTDHMTLITADGTRIPITATIIGTEDHVIIDTPDSLTASIGTAIEDKKKLPIGHITGTRC
ncbi:VCBS domain-containing protein [Vibrio aestuarianus]|uniref:VCBS domain-containing protein n=1 Tax=Vibrio aestuarianus TaxID=28171 RepID=UPI003BB789D6